MHTHTHECTHIRTHTHMHAHTNTHMHTGTHTCKHTHTQKGYSQISETLPTKHSTWFTCYNFKRKILKSMWILKKVYLFPYKIILLSEPEFRKSSKHKKLLFFSFFFFNFFIFKLLFFHGSRPSTWIKKISIYRQNKYPQVEEISPRQSGFAILKSLLSNSRQSPS